MLKHFFFFESKDRKKTNAYIDNKNDGQCKSRRVILSLVGCTNRASNQLHHICKGLFRLDAPTASILCKNYIASRLVWMLRLIDMMCSKTRFILIKRIVKNTIVY